MRQLAHMKVAVLALLASAGVLTTSPAHSESADYEFLATLVSPCILGADQGDMAASATYLPMKEGDDPRGISASTGRRVWRFSTNPGELYISVSPTDPHTCTLTAYGVCTLTANAALMHQFGNPDLSVGSSIHETFKTRSGGRLIVDLWPTAEAEHPGIVAVYTAAAHPPPA